MLRLTGGAWISSWLEWAGIREKWRTWRFNALQNDENVWQGPSLNGRSFLEADHLSVMRLVGGRSFCLKALRDFLCCFGASGEFDSRSYYHPSHTSCECLSTPGRLEGFVALRFVRDNLVPLRQEPCRAAVRYTCKREVHGWTMTYERANEGRGIAVLTRDGDTSTPAPAVTDRAPIIM